MRESKPERGQRWGGRCLWVCVYTSWFESTSQSPSEAITTKSRCDSCCSAMSCPPSITHTRSALAPSTAPRHWLLVRLHPGKVQGRLAAAGALRARVSAHRARASGHARAAHRLLAQVLLDHHVPQRPVPARRQRPDSAQQVKGAEGRRGAGRHRDMASIPITRWQPILPAAPRSPNRHAPTHVSALLSGGSYQAGQGRTGSSRCRPPGVSARAPPGGWACGRWRAARCGPRCSRRRGCRRRWRR